jgi:hypothetical protein
LDTNILKRLLQNPIFRGSNQNQRTNGPESKCETFSILQEALKIRDLLFDARAKQTLSAHLMTGRTLEIGFLSENMASPELSTNIHHDVVMLPKNANSLELQSANESINIVVATNILHKMRNYRHTFAELNRVLKDDGFLFLRVPHQFMFEKRFDVPSAFDSSTNRFYTPASLLLEVEESLDPLKYRLRFLGDDDEGFDPETPFDQEPSGSSSVVLLLQKVTAPSWGDKMRSFGERQIEENTYTADFPSSAGPAPVKAVRTSDSPIREILLLKLDHRGDLILAESAFARFRNAFPLSKITLVCGEWNVAEAQKLGYFDQVIGFSLFQEQANTNRPDTYMSEAIRFGQRMRGNSYDLAVDLRLFGDTRFVLDMVTAKCRAGFSGGSGKRQLDIELPFLSSTEENRPVRGFFECASFATNVGHHSGVMIGLDEDVVHDTKDVIIYGPYRRLDSGDYRVIVHIESGDANLFGFDVCCDIGNTILTGGVIWASAGRNGFDLTLERDVTDLEVRIRPSGKTVPPFRFYGCSFSKVSKLTGPHQSELMAMLATLVEERLRFSPVIEVITK